VRLSFLALIEEESGFDVFGVLSRVPLVTAGGSANA
jgi:hypothetical protein